jgi:ATPase subunit of ABC transporter with duplicated ATPase domains
LICPRLPETDKISPPLLQADEITFGYTPDKTLLKNVNFDVGLDSRIAMVGANGAGKSTVYWIFCFIFHSYSNVLLGSNF